MSSLPPSSPPNWHPPGWQPDPAGPGRLRWWDGRAWTAQVSLPGPPPGGTVGPPGAALRAGAAAGLRRWRSWLVIGHLTGVPLFGAYLAMVGLNSWLYDYSFWNDPPPTDSAEAFATASLWGLLVVVAFCAVLGWTWMCRHALGGQTLRASGWAALGWSLRASWCAMPLMVVTAACVLLLVPGIPAVALLGITPFLSLAPSRPPGGYTGLVAGNAASLALVGLAALPIGAMFWGMVGMTALLAVVWPPLAVLVGWGWFCVGSVLLGGTAGALAHIYRQAPTPRS